MKNLPVRLDRGDASVTFHLSPFITEWERAVQTFMSCITRELGDQLAVRPQDFSVAAPTDFGETWCKYRIFNGSRTIILRPDSLQFGFPGVSNADYPLLNELIGKGMRILLSEIGDYGRSSYSIFHNCHVAVTEGSAEAFVARFADRGMADAVQDEPLVTYRPSASFSLGTGDGSRVLSRTVEQSEVLPNGLFITTHLFTAASAVMTSEEEKHWIERISQVADRAIGIEFQTEEVDDEPGGQ